MQPGEVRIVVEGAGAHADAVRTLDKWLAGERDQGLGDRPRRIVPREDGEPVQGLLADIVLNLGTDGVVALVGVLVRSLHSHLRNQPDPGRSVTVRLPNGSRFTVPRGEMTQGEFEALTLRIVRALNQDDQPG
ncbi:effector-associated constant component EACC1 [Peterkaempfera bronchialis]|uniref:Uncharacterized protein n=1 Tax=Peterkaempfera bronchialis TaxID=2126346 RepID=A0A345T328_9ACTN|nr:hypothetical protein [Peterkaempfera bronchialis]AXI80383.1 hypothetical protein C7M71_026270 [Peterkaempfera bronchialis]